MVAKLVEKDGDETDLTKQAGEAAKGCEPIEKDPVAKKLYGLLFKGDNQ